MDFDFFAALRRMKGPHRAPRPVQQALPEPAPVQPPVLAPVRSIGRSGIALIKRFEGCAKRRADGRFEAYPDPGSGAEPWTIGWGATGADVRAGLIWTQDQCDARLTQDLKHFSGDVVRTLGAAPVTQEQFDALVSFHYNTGAIAKATLTRLHKTGRYAEAAVEFGKWVHAGGKRLPGLVRRRAAEAKLYASGTPA